MASFDRSFYKTAINVCLLPIVFWLIFLLVLPSSESNYITNVWTTQSGVVAPLEIKKEWKMTRLTSLERRAHTDVFQWYKLPIEKEWCKSSPVIFIPKQKWGVQVFLDNEKVAESFHRSLVAPNWHAPLLFNLPPNLCFSSDDLYLRMQYVSNTTLLSPFYVGPASLIVNDYFTLSFMVVNVPQLMSLLLWLMSAGMMLYFWLGKNVTIYGWFSLLVGLWALHSTLRLVVVPEGFPYWIWAYALTGSMVWFAQIAVIFIHRFIGIRPVQLETVLLAINAGLSVVILIMQITQSEYYRLFAGFIWIAYVLAQGLYLLIRLLLSTHCSLQEKSWLGSAMLVILTVGLHDFLIVNQFLQYRYHYYLHHSAFILIVTFLTILIFRLQRSYSYQRKIRKTAQRRLRENHQQYRYDKSELLKNERKRIMSNLHDGVKGYLVAAIHSIRGGKAKPDMLIETLQYSIDDLRGVIDSLDEELNNLDMLLANFRYRYESRLNASNIHVKWHNDTTGDISVDADMALNLLRILQEVTSNIIQHAEATIIDYRFQDIMVDYQQLLLIEVKDNGVGMGVAGGGRGLKNIRMRADALCGYIDIHSDGTGTSIAIRIPVKNTAPNYREGQC